jgi:hypothetical protein
MTFTVTTLYIMGLTEPTSILRVAIRFLLRVIMLITMLNVVPNAFMLNVIMLSVF